MKIKVLKSVSLLLLFTLVFCSIFLLSSCEEKDCYIDENGNKVYITTCSDCLGSGTSACKSCKGTGKATCNLCKGSCKLSCSSCHKCTFCGGNGARNTNGTLTICTYCKGEGRTECSVNCDDGYLPCYTCSGGTIQCKSCSSGKKICQKCSGSGKVKID